MDPSLLQGALLQVGAVGIVVSMSIVGWVAWPPYIRELQEANRLLREANRELTAAWDQKGLPALIEAATAVKMGTEATLESRRQDAALMKEISEMRGELRSIATAVDRR